MSSAYYDAPRPVAAAGPSVYDDSDILPSCSAPDSFADAEEASGTDLRCDAVPPSLLLTPSTAASGVRATCEAPPTAPSHSTSSSASTAPISGRFSASWQMLREEGPLSGGPVSGHPSSSSITSALSPVPFHNGAELGMAMRSSASGTNARSQQEDREQGGCEEDDGVGGWILLSPASASPPAAASAPAPAADPRPARSSAPVAATADKGSLLREIDALRASCEERSFSLLEAQRRHDEETRALRADLIASQRDCASLRNQLCRSGNAALAAALAGEGEAKAVRDEAALLRVRLATVTEDRDKLAARLRSGAAAAAAAAAAAEAQAARSDLAAAQSSLRSREEEVRALRADLAGARAVGQEQSARLRALTAEVSSALCTDGGDAVRAEAAEAEVARLSAELEKRLGQLHKVMSALERVREREASARAAVDAQSASLAQLTAGLSAAEAEADRWRAAVDKLQARHAEVVDEADRWREEVERLREERDAERDAVEAAVRSAHAVKALKKALDLQTEEKEGVEAQLAGARAESRRELAALQRRCDEQADVIAALRADLEVAAEGGPVGSSSAAAMRAGREGLTHAAAAAAAAAAATAASSGAAGHLITSPLALLRGGYGGGDDEGDDGGSGASDIHSVGGDTVPGSLLGGRIAGRFGGMAGAGGAASSAAGHAGVGAASSARGVAGAASTVALLEREAAALRIQCESLSRQLASREERLTLAETDREALLEVNERLRTELESLLAAAAAGERQQAEVPGLSDALAHAQTMQDRHTRFLRAAAAASLTTTAVRGGQAAGGAEAGATTTTGSTVAAANGAATTAPAAPQVPASVLRHIQATEAAFESVGGLVRAVHGLSGAIRAQLDADVGHGGGPSAAAAEAGGLLDAYASGDDAILVARLAQVKMPADSVFPRDGCAAAASSATPGAPPPPPPTPLAPLTNPSLLARLVVEATEAAQTARAEIAERAALSLGQACTQQ
jgi:hypothetical protein